MKIAVIIERYDPIGGGAERSTAQIVNELADRGHQVTLLAGTCSLDVSLERVTIQRFSTRKKLRGAIGLFRFARWARRQVASGGFDTSLSVTTAVAAAVVQPRGGTVKEAQIRNIALRPTPGGQARKRLMLAISPKQQLLLRFERRTLTSPRVKRIVAVSQYVVEQLERHYRVPRAKVIVIPNAAQMPYYSDDERARLRRLVRDGFNVAESDTVYLFAALNPRLKGLDPLLRAAKLLKERGVKFTLLLAGSMAFSQQELAERFSVRDVVRIVGPTNRVADLFCAADVTVLPTYYDPSSKVVIESLMMSVPAISTAFNGASEFIRNADRPGAVRGRVIPDPGDATALAAAMQELADPAEREKCRAAMNGLADELSMKRHVDRLEQVLRETAARP